MSWSKFDLLFPQGPAALPRRDVCRHTLHPTPYTLHPTPYTLLSTPCTEEGTTHLISRTFAWKKISSQGKNLALTVSFVPNSLDSAPQTSAASHPRFTRPSKIHSCGLPPLERGLRRLASLYPPKRHPRPSSAYNHRKLQES